MTQYYIACVKSEIIKNTTDVKTIKVYYYRCKVRAKDNIRYINEYIRNCISLLMTISHDIISHGRSQRFWTLFLYRFFRYVSVYRLHSNTITDGNYLSINARYLSFPSLRVRRKCTPSIFCTAQSCRIPHHSKPLSKCTPMIFTWYFYRYNHFGRNMWSSILSMSCLSLLIQVTHFVHLIHILKRANHLICILGNMCDIFRYQFYINISRFAIHVKRCSPLKPLFIYRGWEGTVAAWHLLP